jgi:hypothetical protein
VHVDAVVLQIRKLTLRKRRLGQAGSLTIPDQFDELAIFSAPLGQNKKLRGRCPRLGAMRRGVQKPLPGKCQESPNEMTEVRT